MTAQDYYSSIFYTMPKREGEAEKQMPRKPSWPHFISKIEIEIEIQKFQSFSALAYNRVLFNNYISPLPHFLSFSFKNLQHAFDTPVSNLNS